MNYPTVADVLPAVEKYLRSVRDSEGQVSVVLNVYQSSFSVDRQLRKGLSAVSITSCRSSSPALTVSERLVNWLEFMDATK